MAKIVPISGFPEWGTDVQMIQERFLDIIRRNFRLYGYCTIDTPSVERVESLSAKGGGENEKEIYSIGRLHGVASDDANLALRFDLTVPMARYVAQHERDIAFPFLRSAIGKVWRGERAQSGRFREFYQCDIDVIGNGSLSLDYDAQIPAIMYAIFVQMSIGDIVIRVNNRKILQGFMQGKGVPREKHKALLTLVDKLEKIGKEEIIRQAIEIGVSSDCVDTLVSFLSMDIPLDQINFTLDSFCDDPEFKDGVIELAYVISKMREFGVPDTSIVVDMSIARGLDYYTGTVYETKLKQYPSVGSVCSGGRYENLVENFSNKKFPGVGMSIGLTRLISRLVEFGVVLPSVHSFADVLLVSLSGECTKITSSLAFSLRNEGIACEQYLAITKIDKQITYASKKGYTYIVIVGDDEISRGVACVRNLKTRDQQDVPFSELVTFFVNK